MSFIDFKKEKHESEYIRRVHSKSIDEYFIDNYDFYYDENSFGFGYSLEKSFKLDDLYYIWVVISKHHIYFYQEYECGGKVRDFTINLEEKFDNKDITAEKLEELIESHF